MAERRRCSLAALPWVRIRPNRLESHQHSCKYLKYPNKMLCYFLHSNRLCVRLIKCVVLLNSDHSTYTVRKITSSFVYVLNIYTSRTEYRFKIRPLLLMRCTFHVTSLDRKTGIWSTEYMSLPNVKVQAKHRKQHTLFHKPYIWI